MRRNKTQIHVDCEKFEATAKLDKGKSTNDLKATLADNTEAQSESTTTRKTHVEIFTNGKNIDLRQFKGQLPSFNLHIAKKRPNAIEPEHASRDLKLYHKQLLDHTLNIAKGSTSYFDSSARSRNTSFVNEKRDFSVGNGEDLDLGLDSQQFLEMNLHFAQNIPLPPDHSGKWFCICASCNCVLFKCQKQKTA